MPDLSVSVVIPVRNESEGLPEMLDSLFAQTLAPHEVVVVDAGSTDGTYEMLLDRAKVEPRLRVLREEGALPGRGRNLAIAASSGDIVAQIDGGCHVASDWLEELTRPIHEDAADYVFGQIVPMTVPRRFFGRQFDMGHVIAAVVHPIIRGAGLGDIAGGASVAYRREIWERVGHFPDWLRCGEDVLFSRKVRALGDVRTAYGEESVAWWQVGPRLRDVYARKVRYSVANAVLDKRMRELRKTLIRTGGALALIVVAPFWLWSLAVLAAGSLFYWLRKVPRALPIYRDRVGAGAEGGWRLFVLSAGVQAAVIAGEEVGMLKGLWFRLRRPDLASRSETYRAGGGEKS